MDQWTCQTHMKKKEDREKRTSRRRTRETDDRRGDTKTLSERTERTTVYLTVTLTSEKTALTFLLPSVTVRGTGMGGHLLRLGGGFSLFHRMMIFSSRGENVNITQRSFTLLISYFITVYSRFGVLTCEQYFDLETTWSSFMIGCDWETNGETAWMTAVNSWPGLTPEKCGNT